MKHFTIIHIVTISALCLSTIQGMEQQTTNSKYKVTTNRRSYDFTHYQHELSQIKGKPESKNEQKRNKTFKEKSSSNSFFK